MINSPCLIRGIYVALEPKSWQDKAQHCPQWHHRQAPPPWLEQDASWKQLEG